ncbi:sodium:calcium antiporter [Sphingobacteriales bacterium UPWRP_1]|nr:sodium:proton exchanger [Sphingobacteriales bacterium TSM_CSM]PSJ72315.1 sodium:calcium antiporter [Sphingobacteriales bacterium UPWRP_1]
MLLNIAVLALGFVLLIKGADWLVSGAASLAKRYNIPELVIGLTIVAFGTSTPELVVNVLASFKGANDIALGNIIGSNNFNLFFILGIAGIIYPLSVNRNTVWREIPYSLLAALIVLLVANDVFVDGAAGNRIDRTDGIMLLLFFAAFLYYAYLSTKTDDSPNDNEEIKVMSGLKSAGFTLAGLALLVAGGKFVVDNAIDIARTLQVSEKLIGLTIVAAGTSLPELATSAVAAMKKRSDIAVGNVVGSNIFNVFFILGTSALIQPINYNTAFNTDCLLLIAGTILLFGVMFVGKRHILGRWEAVALLLVFLGYTGYLIFMDF